MTTAVGVVPERLVDGVLHRAAGVAAGPHGHQELASLVGPLEGIAAALDVPSALAELSTGEPRLILGRHPAGPVLGLRWYAPREVTTVHHHAWTVLVPIAGDGRFERWPSTPRSTLMSPCAPAKPPISTGGYAEPGSPSTLRRSEAAVLAGWSCVAGQPRLRPSSTSHGRVSRMSRTRARNADA